MSQYWRPGTDREVADAIPIHSRHSRLPISHQRSLLPIASYKHQILYALEKYRILVIVGETGTGKSTQIPQYLHEAGWTRSGTSHTMSTYHNHDNNNSNRNQSSFSSDFKAIVCTQPRRIATVNVSTRVAEEFGCKLGEEVGYNVRFHTKISSRTIIKYCTDGVLLRETLSDPLLSKYSVVMIDEAHERSLQSDLLIGIIKKIMKKRLDLRLIITSATMNADILVSYFTDGIDHLPKDHDHDANHETSLKMIHVLSIQGRLHPVDIYYLPNPTSNYIKSTVETIISIHQSQKFIEGDILVFFPGSEEIDRASDMLQEYAMSYHIDSDLIILPLHSSLPNNIQMAVFESTPVEKRKIILATNIAETSVTIEGIAFVIDTGFVKLNYFDVESNVEYLVTCSISKASAQQRAGRAGRTAYGKCYRLYSEEVYKDMIEYTPSEMQRIEISWAIIQLKALGISNILRFDYLNPPKSSHVIYALEFLYSLDAIDIQGDITLIGEKISEMSIDIRLAKCLLSSYELGCSEEMLSIAAMCSVEYPFQALHRLANTEMKKRHWECISEFAALEGDHMTLLHIYNRFIENGSTKSYCDSMNLQYKILSRAKEIRYHLEKMLIFYLKDYLLQQNIKVMVNRSSTNDNSSVSNVSNIITSVDEIILSSCGSDTIAIRKTLVAGYFSNAAKLGSDGNYQTIRGQVRVVPHSSSIIANYGALPEWIIYHEAIHTKDMPQIRDITKIDPMWLLEIAPHFYKVNK